MLLFTSSAVKKTEPVCLTPQFCVNEQDLNFIIRQRWGENGTFVVKSINLLFTRPLSFHVYLYNLMDGSIIYICVFVCEREFLIKFEAGASASVRLHLPALG